jgi:23S rRNA pseudouridine1911/1915/1917 synthase
MKNTEQLVKLSTIIPISMAGLRLDQALAALFPEFSRACLQNWIKKQQVLIDGKVKRVKDSVHGGENVAINAVLEKKGAWQAQAIQLDIVYEDESLLVINKPVGLVVHPAPGNPDQTLVNALLHHCPSLVQLPRAGIIHRLDKNTSGLLVVAKTLTAHTELVRQMQARLIQREYLAIVCGTIISGGTIDVPIGRHPIQRKQMAVIHSGRTAITHYRVLERFPAHTMLKVNLETGRTHQIRVHMAYIRHPIVGDNLYGSRLQIPKGCSNELAQILRHFKHQALHATRLGLQHPVTHAYIEWIAPPPADIEQLLQLLREKKVST